LLDLRGLLLRVERGGEGKGVRRRNGKGETRGDGRGREVNWGRKCRVPPPTFE